jgi:two-component system NarL family sensor kinase
MSRHLQMFDSLPRGELRTVDKSLFPWVATFDGKGFSFAEVADQVLKAHDYERERIGQELHDSAGQLLVSLQLSVARLRGVDENCLHERLLEEILDTVGQIDREIRTLSFLHHPAELGDTGLYTALSLLARGFGRRTGICTSFKCLGGQITVDESISIALLRVAQEALVNIHRHSHASTAKVTLEKRGDFLRLTVSDDGIGLPNSAVLAETEGIGLQGMRHRIEMLDGRFRITNLKHGARISATVPVAA